MNDLSNCFFCKVPLKTSTIRKDFYRCPLCGTMYGTNQQELSSYVDGNFRKYYEQNVVKIMHNDIKHYQRIAGRPDIRRLVDANEFKYIYSFGGGMPKLESILPCQAIIVYDVNADIYENNVNEFRSLYQIEQKPIIFKNDIVNANLIRSIPSSYNDLFTFVHFFEHIDALDMRLILDAVPHGVTVLIYQPNVSRGKNPNWFHYSDQHITLIAGNKMLELARLWYDAVVTIFAEIDDDFLLVFEKPIK